MKNIKSH